MIYDTFGGFGSFAAAAGLSLAAFFFMCAVDTRSIDPSRKGWKGSEESARRKPQKGLARFFEKRTVPAITDVLEASPKE